MSDKCDVLVIGAGPAGLFAAGVMCGDKSFKITVAEKNNSPGKKLLITGKGRCNLTNDSDISDFFDNIVNNREFLYSSFYGYTNTQLMEFFESSGVPLKVERGNRVFPVSDKSIDILKALRKYSANADFRYNAPATGLIVENGHIKGAEFGETVIYAKRVLLATGGLSYPKTGSTGDGFKMAKQVGHRITKLKPALVPLITYEDTKALEGLSLKNVGVSLFGENGKKLYEDFGEMLFTSNGVSGPVILSMSSFVPDGKPSYIEIDLKPALSAEKTGTRIIKDFEKYSNKNFSNSLDDLLPKKMIPVMVKASGIAPDKKVNQITAAERKKLVECLKKFRMDIKCKGSINDAIVTDGGIDVSGINPSTMESKIIKGLYFAGEIIDVHGYTGGYNLQIAFSTGHLAGVSILESLKSEVRL